MTNPIKTENSEPLYKATCDTFIGFNYFLTLAVLAKFPPGEIAVWKDHLVVSQRFMGIKVTAALKKTDIDKITPYKPARLSLMPGIRFYHHNKKVKPLVAAALYVDFEKTGKAIQVLKDCGYPVRLN